MVSNISKTFPTICNFNQVIHPNEQKSSLSDRISSIASMILSRPLTLALAIGTGYLLYKGYSSYNKVKQIKPAELNYLPHDQRIQLSKEIKEAPYSEEALNEIKSAKIASIDCSMEDLNDCVKDLADWPIGWDVKIEGCFLRSFMANHIINTVKLSEENHVNFSGYVFQVAVYSPGLSISAPWISDSKKIPLDLHCASAIKLKDKIMILDPTLDKTKALELSEWVALLDPNARIDTFTLLSNSTKRPTDQKTHVYHFSPNSVLSDGGETENIELLTVSDEEDIEEIHLDTLTRLALYSQASEHAQRLYTEEGIDPVETFTQILTGPHIEACLEKVKPAAQKTFDRLKSFQE